MPSGDRELVPVCTSRRLTIGGTLGPMRGAGLLLLLVSVVLCGCSSSNGSSPTTTHPGSLNVTPCNYAQVWHDYPTQFSEFGTVARVASKATDADLRTEGQQLAAAVASHNTAALGQVMGNVFATCGRLGLVRTSSASATTG
jgi:hypothetical protein